MVIVLKLQSMIHIGSITVSNETLNISTLKLITLNIIKDYI